MAFDAAVVNVFATPFEEWSKRPSTDEERKHLMEHEGKHLMASLEVNDQLISTVSTHKEAATRMLHRGADIALENHIDRALSNSDAYRNLRGAMPVEEPEALSAYQGIFSSDGWIAADQAIQQHGVTLAEGQTLFHGGRWAESESKFVTLRPFSTSFCPQVALRNADWKGKAYDADRVDLMVIHVSRPKTKAYAFSRDGDHGNEKEVVFASGAQLKLLRETKVGEYSASKAITGLHCNEISACLCA